MLKNKKYSIGIYLICAIMTSIGLTWDIEGSRRLGAILPYTIFVMVLGKIIVLKIWEPLRAILFCVVTLAGVLGASLADLPWSPGPGLLLGLGSYIVCFFILALRSSVCTRRLVSRWNDAYAVWKSGGSAEDCLKELEQCEAMLEKYTSVIFWNIGGIPLQDGFSFNKLYLLKEMGRDEECLALLKAVQPKLKNAEMQKALLRDFPDAVHIPEEALEEKDEPIARHGRHSRKGFRMKRVLLLGGIIVYIIIIVCSTRAMSKQTYSIVGETNDYSVFYPQIKSDSFDTSACNETLKDNRYGPYTVLFEEAAETSMDFEVTHHSRYIISVRYEGTYTTAGASGENISFGITVDVLSGKILTLDDLLKKNELQRIKKKVKRGNFKLIKEHLSLEAEMEKLDDFWTESNPFQFCLGQKSIFLILYGLPSYPEDYAIIQVNR